MVVVPTCRNWKQTKHVRKCQKFIRTTSTRLLRTQWIQPNKNLADLCFCLKKKKKKILILHSDKFVINFTFRKASFRRLNVKTSWCTTWHEARRCTENCWHIMHWTWVRRRNKRPRKPANRSWSAQPSTDSIWKLSIDYLKSIQISL